MKKLKFKLNETTGALSEEDARRYFSRVGLATFVMTVVYQLGGALIMEGVWRLFPKMMSYPLVNNLISLIPLYGLAVPLFYMILNTLPRDRVQPEKMKGGPLFKGLCVSLFVMMGGNYVSQIFLTVFQLLSGRTLVNPVAATTSAQSFWINLLFIAVIAPILEELVFRKMLCERLLPLGEGYAIVLSAAIFGLAHGNLFQFLYAFLLGMIFALIYVKTGRLRYTILYHGILNLLGSVISTELLRRVEHLLSEEAMYQVQELSEQGTTEALSRLVKEFLLPMLPLLAYELVIMVFSVCGMVFLIIGYKKIRLEKGLLPPPEKGKAANLFLNGGVAAALGAYAIVFVLSLLA